MARLIQLMKSESLKGYGTAVERAAEDIRRVKGILPGKALAFLLNPLDYKSINYEEGVQLVYDNIMIYPDRMVPTGYIEAVYDDETLDLKSSPEKKRLVYSYEVLFNYRIAGLSYGVYKKILHRRGKMVNEKE